MSRTVTYVRKGSNLDGSFQALTPGQLALLNQDKAAFLLAGGDNSPTPGLGGKIYSDILSFISHPSGTELPGLPTVTLNSQVSPAVFNWIAGAQDVNVGTSFAAILIQDYTIDQFTYRTGTDAGALTAVRKASNQIALNVANDLITNGNIPDIAGIGALDAGAIAATVFGNDYAGWTGALLFPYLGVNSFYEDWILNSQPFSAVSPNGKTVPYKSTSGSYDLIAAIEAGFQASKSAAFSNLGNFIAAAAAYGNGPPGVTADPTPLIAETNAWFAAYYALPSANGTLPPTNGFTALEFLPGHDLTFSSPLRLNITYALGTLAANSNILLNQVSGPGIAVGGPGNDTINVSTTGDVLLDGGGGDNQIHVGNGRAIAYGGGTGNNTVYGNAMTNPSMVDILIGDGGNSPAADTVMGGPVSSAPRDGTDTIYAQSNSNILVGGTGKNDFYLDVNNYKPLLNIIWGNGAPSSYHFTETAPAFASGNDDGGFSVFVLHLDNTSIASLETLDVNAIRAKFFSTYAPPYGPKSFAVIINPSAQDKIYLDGTPLDGGVYGVGLVSGTSTYYDYIDKSGNDYSFDSGSMFVSTPNQHRFNIRDIKPGDFGISPRGNGPDSTDSKTGAVGPQAAPSGYFTYAEQNYITDSLADTVGRAIGTASGDTLTATSGTTTFDGHGAPGGSMDFEGGLGGQDTFIFNKGYGILEVNQDDQVYTNPPTLANVLQFGPGISLPQIKVTATINGDLMLVMGYAGDIVKLDGEVGADTSVSLGVQKATFADGSSVTRQQLNSLAQPDALFNAKFYLASNPDVASSGMDPYQHYIEYGWREGRNPDALFDTNYYLAQNPDVKAAGIDPLLHFESNGRQEGREPSLLFSDAKYLTANPDVAASGINPLLHYVAYGKAEGRTAFLAGGTAAADPLVVAAYYDKQLGATLIPAGVAGQQQAAAGYDATGWQKGLNPDAFFNTSYYLAHNPDVAAAHVDPLTQFETTGWKQGRDPSAQFSTNKYLAAYSDVKAAGMDPLLHYVMYGQAEGRTAFAA